MAALASCSSTLLGGPAAHKPAEREIPRLVRKSAKAVGQAVVAAQEAADPAARDEALHEVRKRIKAARYAAEAAVDVVRGADKRTVHGRKLQDTLGEYQDSIVARQVIAKVSQQARQSNEDTFTFGVLGEREAATARTILGDSAKVLAPLAPQPNARSRPSTPSPDASRSVLGVSRGGRVVVLGDPEGAPVQPQRVLPDWLKAAGPSMV